MRASWLLLHFLSPSPLRGRGELKKKHRRQGKRTMRPRGQSSSRLCPPAPARKRWTDQLLRPARLDQARRAQSCAVCCVRRVVVRCGRHGRHIIPFSPTLPRFGLTHTHILCCAALRCALSRDAMGRRDATPLQSTHSTARAMLRCW
ncbi:hypothetical protein IWX46DRAFT_435419 [Phyllosticta citricarpa]|uniref:Secreted protein n=1 Tax=Phyllosticta citricarpa TaxID=55181 RepID=A0ABR1L3X4_9PEZI